MIKDITEPIESKPQTDAFAIFTYGTTATKIELIIHIEIPLERGTKAYNKSFPCIGN